MGAMSAKRFEPIDVVADVASARARRFRGGVRGARAPLLVCKSRFGRYAWAGARQGAFAHVLTTSTASSGAFDALNAPAPSPEARVGRCALRGAGDAKQPRKRRESARRARAGARETVMPVPERLRRFN